MYNNNVYLIKCYLWIFIALGLKCIVEPSLMYSWVLVAVLGNYVVMGKIV